jgi:hypothetical protein
MARSERAAVGMSDERWLFGKLESVQRRAVAAMRNVHGHPDFIHALDDGGAEITDSVIAPLGRAVADQVTAVVSELRNALPESAKEVHVGGGAELVGILKPEQDADLAGSLYAVERRRVVYPHEMLAVVGDEAVPRGEEPQRRQISLRPAKPDGDVKDIDARIFVWLEIGGIETVRIGKPRFIRSMVRAEYSTGESANIR